MEYVRLGRSGMKVSRICLGCMSFGSGFNWMVPEDDQLRHRPQGARSRHQFLRHRQRLFGRRERADSRPRAESTYGVKREALVIATKVFAPTGKGPNDRGLSRKHILHSIDESLRRLGLDYVDLYQIHRFDLETPLEETLEALNDVVKAGKVRYLGASSMPAYQFAKMLYTRGSVCGSRASSACRTTTACCIGKRSARWCRSVARRALGSFPTARSAAACSPAVVAAGTTRSNSVMARDRFNRKADEAVIDAVAAVAEQRGIGAAQVAIAWLLAQGAVTAPIVGATKASHLEDSVKAVGTRLSSEEIAKLEGAYETQPILPYYFRPPPDKK